MQYPRHVSRSIVCALLLSWSLPAWAAPGLIILDNPLRLSFTGFASSLAVVGDLDGDGVADYLVGAYEHYWNGALNQGRAFVFSGQSGKLLFPLDLPHPHPGAAFGNAVAAAGNVNQDGVPDLLVGAFGQGESGQAFVFNGKTGKLLYTLRCKPRSDNLGLASAGQSPRSATSRATVFLNYSLAHLPRKGGGERLCSTGRMESCCAS